MTTSQVSPPIDVGRLILKYLEKLTGEWFNAMLVCKSFLSAGREIFNPSIVKPAVLKKMCKRNNIIALKLLLTDKRIDPAVNRNHAIRWAALCDHNDLVDILFSDTRVYTTINNDRNYVARDAVYCGYTYLFQLLLKHDMINPSMYENECIRHASAGGHLEIVKLLLADERVSPSAYENYALRTASQGGHTEIVRLLLKHPKIKLGPLSSGALALQAAAKHGHIEIVKLLLGDMRIDLLGDNNSALMDACRYDHLDIAEMIIHETKRRKALKTK